MTMAGTGDCHAKQNKPDSRSQVSYVWSQEKNERSGKCKGQGVRETKEEEGD